MWCSAVILCLGIIAAEAQVPAVPVISIVLDDLGNDQTLGKRALALPGKLTYAFLPQTPFAAALSHLAHVTARESIVHLPMQSLDGRTMGPGALTLEMDAAELHQTLKENLDSVPFAVGANNHMGSALTGDTQTMSQLMAVLAAGRKLYFLDSRTHESTIAEQVALQAGVPTTRRDLFLDNQRDESYIDQQLSLLIAMAKNQGSAVAIGHPYPETLRVLSRRLPELSGLGVQLVPLSQLIERRSAEKSTSSLQKQSIVSINSTETKTGEH